MVGNLFEVLWSEAVVGYSSSRPSTLTYYIDAKDELEAYTKAMEDYKKNLLRCVLTEETYNALQEQSRSEPEA